LFAALQEASNTGGLKTHIGSILEITVFDQKAAA